MTVTLESTSKIVTINGIPTRIWEGKTAKGIECHAFIARIAVHKDEDSSEFDQELCQTRPPSAEVDQYPARITL